MVIDDKEIEDKYKSALFKKTGEMSSAQHELISEIHKIGSYINLDEDVPNIRNYVK